MSGKVEDIESDSNINVAFISDTGQWASVAGTAVIEKDRERVRKHYSPALKAWLGDLYGLVARFWGALSGFGESSHVLTKMQRRRQA